jgi:RNA polymerase sigma factor (sigma-70 family)
MEDWRTEIDAMLRDDLRAVDRFFAVWRPRIYRWASGGEYSWRADPDDVAQEVLLKLTRNHCRALVEWRGMDDEAANSEANLAAYLHRICENTARDLRRARGRNRAEPLDENEFWAGPDSDPLALLEGQVLTEALAEAYFGLSAPDQQILALRFNHGYSLQQLAEQLGITPNNAGQRAHRAEKRLHARLADVTRCGRAGRGRT